MDLNVVQLSKSTVNNIRRQYSDFIMQNYKNSAYYQKLFKGVEAEDAEGGHRPNVRCRKICEKGVEMLNLQNENIGSILDVPPHGSGGTV